ncbi:polynucleotide adenylyltransferase PcnB [Aestuariibacter halophilus]|uniref:Poly(A) polymerase I n=1 Tax=Fluctibacter halophilus TaxID=226011 RepID=A0ABS8G9C8_9ALTE|nr:polynucleotide adenylyltransferase PcnB [Aestuariibacter halophilus]MCC2617155.1 polynucleotide adenylyltransferase PcnB [Aestuariibacter halophilus]
MKRALGQPQSASRTPLTPKVLSRAEHGISRDDISENALKVLYRLHNGGYQAYLVGGCVRDLMLGLHPKDFDVVTDATPEQVKGLFRNCRLIGRRFRLAHIVFGRDIIEVATFRGHHQSEEQPETLGKQNEDGQILRDNVFGSIEEDAERRDFTINAMYYNIADYTVTDFADGMSSIKNKRLDLIGDPHTRYREDPVRMLRAVRFAAKLNMTIGKDSADAIHELHGLLANIPAARLFEEVLKLLVSGQGLATYRLLREYQLFDQLFPQLKPLLRDNDSRENQFIEQVLINTDNRINTGQRVTPAFLYAAMLWYPLEEHCQKLMLEAGLNHHDAFSVAINDVLHRQIQRIMIPKRFSTGMRDIWHMQPRLAKRFGRRAYQLLEHPKFRAAYDFLLLRGQIEGGELLELADWWTQFQDADANDRKAMLNKLRGGQPAPRKRRRRRPKRDSSAPS